MLTLAQADPAASSALYSVAGILTATWLIVAFVKRLAPEYIVGRVTLLVALAVSVGLTLYARYGAGWIDADLPSTLLAVLTGVAGAAGIDASGRAVMGKTPAVLIPLGLSLLLLGGCTGVPGQIIVSHADLAGADHLRRVDADPDATDAERETWHAHWAAIRAAGESGQ